MANRTLKRMTPISMALALLGVTIAPRCPAQSNSVLYVLDKAGSPAVVMQFGGARVVSDGPILGSLTLAFSHDASGDVVDGPVQLSVFGVQLPVEGLGGAVTISLDSMVTDAISGTNGHLTFLDVPVTIDMSLICAVYCAPLKIPDGQSSSSVSVLAKRVEFELVGGELSIGKFFMGDPVFVDLGLGQISFAVEFDFRGSS